MDTSSLVAVLVSAILTVSCWIFKSMLLSKRSRLRYPPAMPSLPVVGSIPFITDRANIHKTFAEKAKQLGNVFSCYIGSRYTVILNERESIREAFLRRASACSDRAENFIMKTYLHTKWKGIVHHGYDAEFIRHHQYILTIFKDFGMGQIGMQQRIQTQIEELTLCIREVEGKSFNPEEHINLCILNVICSTLFGKRSPQSNPDLKRLSRIVHKTTASYLTVVDLFPPLRFIPYYWNCIRKTVLSMKEQKKLISDMIRSCLENETAENSIVAAFVEKEGPECDRENLIELVRQLIFAGSDTTTYTVLWTLFLLANRPELQKRLHDELDSVVPSHRLPSIGDVVMLPLTEATVLESMRFKTIVPLALPHKTSCDTEVAGYYIPKDTTILPNIYAVHMDKNEWKDPDEFRPERFLDESGSAVVGRDRLMPFSIGKRSCTAEGIARPMVFMIISSLVKQFDVYPPTGKDKVECEESTYIVNRPSAFEIRLVSRERH